MPRKVIFQQNGVTIHTAKSSMKYFDAKEIEIFPWLAKSPDFNPIENVWGRLLHEISKEGKQYNTVNILENAIMSAWNKLYANYLTKLNSSMKNRIFKVIIKKW